MGYYDYYGFGKEYSAGTSDFSGNRYQFTAREWHSESSEYYYHARRYNPSLSRFTSRDPIASINSYLYALNNSIRYIDPLGLDHEASDVLGSAKPGAWKTSDAIKARGVLCGDTTPPGGATEVEIETEAGITEEMKTWVTQRGHYHECCCEKEEIESVIIYGDQSKGSKTDINDMAHNLGGDVLGKVKTGSDALKSISNIVGHCNCIQNLTILTHSDLEKGGFEFAFETGEVFDKVTGKQQGKLFGEKMKEGMCEPCTLNIMACNADNNNGETLIALAKATGCTILGAIGVVIPNVYLAHDVLYGTMLHAENCLHVCDWVVVNGIAQYDPSGKFVDTVDGQGNTFGKNSKRISSYSKQASGELATEGSSYWKPGNK